MFFFAASPNGLPDLCPALLNDHIFNQSCLILVKTAVPNNYPDLGVVAHEVSTCAQFQHPNVVFLYGIALRGEHSFLNYMNLNLPRCLT